MKRLYFIYNPTAGKSSVKGKLSEIIDRFTKADYEVTVRPTQYSRDAVNAAEYACSEEYDLLVCAGGDGTLNECIEGVMNSYTPVPIGYIPTGTVNDFGRSLGIPRGIMNAVEWIIDGTPTACDIGKFNRRYFTYVAAFGAFTNASYETPQALKNRMGRMAYLLNGAKNLNTIKSYKIRVEAGDDVFEDEYTYGMISNTASIGGMFPMSNFMLDDGIFEVLLIRKPTNPVMLQKALSFMLSKEKEDDASDVATYFRSDSLKVTALGDEPLDWTIDGEYGGNDDVSEITNIHKAVTFMVGPLSENKDSYFDETEMVIEESV